MLSKTLFYQKKVEKEILLYVYGATMYEAFIDKISKRKLKTVTVINKVVKVHIKDKVVRLKEESKSMLKLIVVSRNKKGDFPYVLWNYDLPIVPHSFFNSDGTPYHCKDKMWYIELKIRLNLRWLNLPNRKTQIY